MSERERIEALVDIVKRLAVLARAYEHRDEGNMAHISVRLLRDAKDALAAYEAGEKSPIPTIEKMARRIGAQFVPDLEKMKVYEAGEKEKETPAGCSAHSRVDDAQLNSGMSQGSPPQSVHWLGDGPKGGCAQERRGCVLYFNSEEDCLEYIAQLTSSATAQDADEPGPIWPSYVPDAARHPFPASAPAQGVEPMAEREKPLGIEDIFDGSYEEFAALRKEALEALPAEVEQGAQISRPGPEWETLTTDQAIADALLHSAQADGAIDRSLAIDVARRLRDCADTARTQIAQLEKVINSHETTIRNAGEQLAEAKAEAARLRVPQKEEE